MSVFNKLAKFDGTGDFKSWLQKFNRCCIITNKVEEEIKGQLILLCLEGQALAIGEQLEYEREGAQTFTEVKDRLDGVFDTSAGRETKMIAFENRTQHVGESEDAFMLELVQLYRSANPRAGNPEFQMSVKRKFMQGIPPELRRAIFVFNSDPYAITVTYQRLLEYARSARLNLVETPTSDGNPPAAASSSQAVNTLHDGASNTSNDEICALRQEIRELRTAFSENLSLHAAPNNVNAVYSSSNRGRGSHQSRGRGRGNRGNRGNRGSWRGQAQNHTPRSTPVICNRCGGPNHIAPHCMQ